MSLLWFDGFEGYGALSGNAALQAIGWDRANGTPAVEAANARTGGFCCQLEANNRIIGRSFGSDGHATLIVGFALRPTTSSSTSIDGIVYLFGDSGTTNHVTLTIKTDGSMEARRGTEAGTILGTTAIGLFTANAWHYLEIKAVLHDTTGSVVVRLNGATILNLTNVDTKNAGTGTIFDAVNIQGAAGFLFRADDVYVCTGVDSGVSGQPHNDFLGDVRVDFLVPNADTATEAWTRSAGSDSFALVDESVPNSDTDYIESDVVNDKTQLGLGALGLSGHTVFGVRAITTAKKTDAGVATMRTGISSNATAANGADVALSTDYTHASSLFFQDPDGDVAWSADAVDALEAFVEVR